jgi:hypothetical protein
MHTKGPWKVEDGDPTMITAMRNGEFFHVADARGWGRLQYEKCGEKEQEDNARLIAAAPEMLEFVEEMANYECSCCFELEEGHHEDCFVNEAKSLLSKIKGR